MSAQQNLTRIIHMAKTKDDFFGPHITDPDDPADMPMMTDEEATRFSENVAAAFPELIDHSLDGPLKLPPR
jgi:hypothetical protein